MIQVVINFDEATGQINVTGPLENKVLMYGLLSAANDVVREYKPPKLQPATISQLGALASVKGNGHG